ncbi:MAG: alpha/beta hydrolase [Ilumatobacteraceae bacterium]
MSIDPVSADRHVWSASAGDRADPLVVLVHGSMDRSAGLLRLSRRLDPRFRVVRFDRRGYGRSTEVGPPWTVDANIDDLALVIETEIAASGGVPGGGSAVVFGHSFGGNVALGVAQRRPDLVSAVAVYETPMSWLDTWPGNSAGSAAQAAPDPGAAAEAFIRRLVGDAAWDRLPVAKQEQRRAEGAAMVAELADLRAAAPWDPSRIGVPVLAMYGEHGRDHHRAAMVGLGDLLDRCHAVCLTDAGHAGPHTHADSVATAFETFVNSLRRDD